MLPSIGREEALLATARDLVHQRYEHWECVVVLQGDVKPGFVDALKSILGNRLRAFHLKEANASLARNVGLLESRGEIVLFLDDDVEIRDSDFLWKHLRHFGNTNVVGVAGQILGRDARTRSDRHWLSRLPRSGWLFFPQTYDKPALIANGGSGNLSVRRSAAVAVGGMDAQYEKGAHREESDFCMRLFKRHGPLVYDPEASLIHLGEATGGCRSWGDNSGLHPLHHVCGEWYFILNGIRLGTVGLPSVPLHLGVLVHRQILNTRNTSSLARIGHAVVLSIRGFRAARRKIREGSRLLPAVPKNVYVALTPLPSVGATQAPPPIPHAAKP